jgi:hypothetical protein
MDGGRARIWWPYLASMAAIGQKGRGF